jgi:hypothetical protein
LDFLSFSLSDKRIWISKKNSKTKVEKAFYFIFMASLGGNEFLEPKKEKKISLNRVQPVIDDEDFKIGQNFPL